MSSNQWSKRIYSSTSIDTLAREQILNFGLRWNPKLKKYDKVFWDETGMHTFDFINTPTPRTGQITKIMQ